MWFVEERCMLLPWYFLSFFFPFSWLLKLSRKGCICYWLYCYINGELFWWSWRRECSGFYRFLYPDQESWGLQLLIFYFTCLKCWPFLNYFLHRFPRLIFIKPLNFIPLLFGVLGLYKFYWQNSVFLDPVIWFWLALTKWKEKEKQE